MKKNVRFKEIVVPTPGADFNMIISLQLDHTTGDLYALSEAIDSPSYITYISQDESNEYSIIKPINYDGIIVDIAFDSSSKELYAIYFEEKKVSVIDAKTKDITNTIPLTNASPNKSQFLGVAFNDDNNQLYINFQPNEYAAGQALIVVDGEFKKTINYNTDKPAMFSGRPVVASVDKLYISDSTLEDGSFYDALRINPITNKVHAFNYHNIDGVTPDVSGSILVDKQEKIFYAIATESKFNSPDVKSYIQKYSTIDEVYLGEFFDDGVNSGTAGFITNIAIDFNKKILYATKEESELGAKLYVIDLKSKKEINQISIPITEDYDAYDMKVNQTTGMVYLVTGHIIYSLEKPLLDFKITEPVSGAVVPANQPVTFKGVGQPGAMIYLTRGALLAYNCTVQDDGTWSVTTGNNLYAGQTYIFNAKEIINTVTVATDSVTFKCE